MAFSPDYVRLVLSENFEDAKRLLLEPLMAIHYAHLTMLTEQSIVTRADARAIRAALDGINLETVRQSVFDGSHEDLFFDVNARIAAACGEDAAGRLHTARSRNDIDMTMYRMRLREGLLSLAEAVARLREALLGSAARHHETIFAAHTHTQPAQPTTVAHYLLAVVEQLERDTARLADAYEVVNQCPLGACAITGTGFPIDRNRTSALLGFSGPTGNTYGSIATADFVLHAAAAAAVLLVGLGRVLQDMLLWSSVEMGYLRLPDGFVQVSSVMPQKRNPVALEHARALASKALGQMNAIQTVVHNTPFGDIVDTEDDLQPLVATAFRDATRATTLTAVTMAGAEFNAAHMRDRSGADWVTVTELADALTRDHGLSFGAAHAVVSALVRRVDARDRRLGVVLADVGREAGHHIHLSDDDLQRLLSPEHFVAVRRTLGGPAPEITAEAVRQSRGLLEADRSETTRRRQALMAASDALRSAVVAI